MTVDVLIQGWLGETGFVTEPLRRLTLQPDRVTAFLCGPEAMMRFGAQALLAKDIAPQSIRVSWSATCNAASAGAGTASSGRCCRAGRPGGGAMTSPGRYWKSRNSDMPSLAVWKFASRDGCQLTILDCEDELLTLAEQVQIATFAGRPVPWSAGPRPVAGRGLHHHALRRGADPRDTRAVNHLVAIGACAPQPAASRRCATSPISASSPRWCMPGRTTSTPWPPQRRPRRTSPSTTNCGAARSTGANCSITLAALLVGCKPRLPAATVCTECKRSGVACVTVAEGIPCPQAVTHAGCGALCPRHHRGCYGCFWTDGHPNMGAMIPLLHLDGMSGDDVDRVFSTFNVTQFADERSAE